MDPSIRQLLLSLKAVEDQEEGNDHRYVSTVIKDKIAATTGDDRNSASAEYPISN